jgi:hypothetical protein
LTSPLQCTRRRKERKTLDQQLEKSLLVGNNSTPNLMIASISGDNPDAIKPLGRVWV